MLNKWTRSLYLPIKSPILTSLSSLIFSKLSISSAANLDTTTINTTIPIVQISTDPVHAILSGFRDLGFRQFVSGHYFKDLVVMLNQAQMDDVIENLSVENADFVVDFYHLSRNEFGFQHSRVSRFLVSHVWREREGLRTCVWFWIKCFKRKAPGQLLCFVSCFSVASRVGIRAMWYGICWLLFTRDLRWFMMLFLFS